MAGGKGREEGMKGGSKGVEEWRREGGWEKNDKFVCAFTLSLPLPPPSPLLPFLLHLRWSPTEILRRPSSAWHTCLKSAQMEMVPNITCIDLSSLRTSQPKFHPPHI